MELSWWQASDADVAAIGGAYHGDPFAVLGLHRAPPGPVRRSAAVRAA